MVGANSISDSPLIRYVAVLSAIILTVFCLRVLSAIFQPIFIAIYLCYFAVPLRNLLVRWKISHYLANALVPIALILFLLFFGWLISINIETLTQNFPRYRDQMVQVFGALLEYLRSLHPLIAKRLDSVSSLGESVLLFDTVGRYLGLGVGSFLQFIGTTVVVGFYMIFLLLEARDLGKRLRLAFGPERANQMMGLFARISDAILVYNRVKGFISFWVALFTTIILLAFHVDSGLFWGVLTFFANFIPYIGPIVITIPPVVIFYLQSGSLALTTLLFMSLISIHMVIGHYLEPKVTGSSLNLSPFLVVFTLAFWGWLWGIVGMILAVPALVALKLALEASPKTRGFAELLGTRK